MKLKSILLVLATASATVFAEIVPSEVQTREWTEKDPPPGITLTNLDRYVDYKRGGQIVFRAIQRTVKMGTKSNPQSGNADQHIIEFVAGGNVFAFVDFGKGEAVNWEVTSGDPVLFQSGRVSGSPDWRFFHVCVPKHDYYEYFETNGTDVKLPSGTTESYNASKRAFLKMVSKGHIHPLGKEKLLGAEEPR